ncbi:MAG: D-alanine--D-alanine ligase, partial [Planctomycetota bacterium]|nr:D-alanine--D-alanine ligase [Planctomycetota bacterium]
MGIRLGVFFGGRSVEHEVSIISAMQAIRAFDKTRYDITPIYIDKTGDMHAGTGLDAIENYRDIPALLARSRRVTLVRDSGRFFLQRHPAKRFSFEKGTELDFAFPVVHGTTVEDGDLQGWFKTIGIPFAGCDVTASALGMDKYHMKAAFRESGIPVLDGMRIRNRRFFEDPDAAVKTIEAFSPYPVIVKPVNLGSSVGIRKASSAEELRDALEYAFIFANAALIERAVVDLREINCAVLGDEDEAVPSECEEPITADAILSYADKYGSGGKSGSGAKGMSSAKRKLPADIPPDTRRTIQDLAVRAFQTLGCNGVARVDFLLDR